MPLVRHRRPGAFAPAPAELRAWLEYMNVADPVLAEPMVPADGAVTAADRPGLGLTWDAAAVARYALRQARAARAGRSADGR